MKKLAIFQKGGGVVSISLAMPVPGKWCMYQLTCIEILHVSQCGVSDSRPGVDPKIFIGEGGGIGK